MLSSSSSSQYGLPQAKAKEPRLPGAGVIRLVTAAEASVTPALLSTQLRQRTTAGAPPESAEGPEDDPDPSLSLTQPHTDPSIPIIVTSACARGDRVEVLQVVLGPRGCEGVSGHDLPGWITDLLE